MIKAGGGAVTSELARKVVFLLPEDAHDALPVKFDGQVVKAKFIDLCCAANQLLPFAGFEVDHKSAKAEDNEVEDVDSDEVEDFEDDELPSGAGASTRAAPSPKRRPVDQTAGKKRLRYTPEEDTALVRWVAKHPSAKVQGDALWKAAERSKVTAHGWESMRNRWKTKHLQRGAEPEEAKHAARADKGALPTPARRREATRSEVQPQVRAVSEEASLFNARGFRKAGLGPLPPATEIAAAMASFAAAMEKSGLEGSAQPLRMQVESRLGSSTSSTAVIGDALEATATVAGLEKESQDSVAAPSKGLKPTHRLRSKGPACRDAEVKGPSFLHFTSDLSAELWAEAAPEIHAAKKQCTDVRIDISDL